MPIDSTTLLTIQMLKIHRVKLLWKLKLLGKFGRAVKATDEAQDERAENTAPPVAGSHG
jgi:hypothetical protein